PGSEGDRRMALASNGPETDAENQPPQAEANGHGTKILMLGALGVVFGDIGTSPIYAFREALHASGGLVSRSDVLGVLSLIVWALTVIVAIKYIAFVLRADNKGEGGTLSLMALARSAYPAGSMLILAIGLCGAALFFGDSVITPARSEEHTSELQSRENLVCRLLLEKKKKTRK